MTEPLEYSPEQIRDFASRLGEDLVQYLVDLGQGPVSPADLSPRGVRRILNEPLPVHGQGLDQVREDLLARVLPHSVRVGHPFFLAWIRASPLAVAVFSEAVTAALNQSVAVWEGAPAATTVENLVIDWLVELSGYREGARGILTSGGSMANFSGLAAARSRAAPGVREHGLRAAPQLMVYLTGEAHYSVQKAVEMLGIGRCGIRVVPTDDDLRMDPSALRALIREDRAGSRKPMAVAATLGTTSTGGCDDLEVLAEVCRDEDVWLHVDGAYGGLARSVRGKEPLARGLEKADSFVLDPHKNLFMPFEAGCLLVRDQSALHRAFAVRTDYLPNTERGDREREAPHHFRDYGPQLSREFRALKIYLSLKAYGAQAITAELAREYRLAEEFAILIEEADDFRTLAEVSLGVTAFQYQPPGMEVGEKLNRINARLVEDVQHRGRVFLSKVRVREDVGFRACFVSHRTRRAHLPVILDEVRRCC